MKDLTRVVIVGFPNVGKSSLFNRLLKEKKALVHSLPGMTRDCIAAPCRLEGKKFVLVDTGGFFDCKEEPLSFKIKEKAWEASRTADILLFVLDGKREILPAEEELFLSLRKLNKPILAVLNKIDSEREEMKIADYYRLGAEKIFAISAEHKRGLENLKAAIASLLPSSYAREEERKPLRIAIVGRINVGKSSLINCLLGEERLIVSEIPGTTRDSMDTLIVRNRKVFCLVDTAGIRKLSRARDKREKASIIKAKKNIAQADVICLIMDAQEFPTHQDVAIASLACESGMPLLLALNKWDLVPERSKSSQEFRGRAYRKLSFVSYAPLVLVSALTGKGVLKILDLAERIYENGCKRIETSRLNDFLTWIMETHPPLTKEKRRVKIKYMTQKGILPPTFLLFSHSPASLSPFYEKFFLQKLRERFDFWGTPLRIILRKG